MADPIRTLSIDSSAWYPLSKAMDGARTLTINETQYQQTGAYLVRRPAGSSTPVTRAAGTPFTFDVSARTVGSVFAEIQAAAGTSMTFDIVEN